MIDFGLYASYTLIGICVVGILFFAVSRIASNPKAAKSALIGIGGLVVLFVIAYAASTGADVATNPVFEKLQVNESTSKSVGAGLIGLYLIMGLTVLSIIYAEVSRLIK